MTKKFAAFMLIAVTVLTARALPAAKPEIVQVTSDTYMIFKEDHKGVFGNLAKMKAAIIKQANEFAMKQGMFLIPISCKEKPLGGGPAQWATFEYLFRLVPKDDPEAKHATFGPCPDVVVQSSQSVTAEVTMKGEKQEAAEKAGVAGDKPTDLYAELLKLDDLRKRELLTDLEFDAEKGKLLNPPGESKEGRKDIYAELLKLDDLRKRGILTDAEFDAEKRKLLNPRSEPEKPSQQQ